MPEPSILISVIMGVCNQRDHEALHIAIRSVLNQTLPDFEFLICDDGSDPSESEYIKVFAQQDKRIRLISHPVNTGLSGALSDCVKNSRGKYIARMDADDASLPDRFFQQAAFLESHPEYDWCGTDLWLFDGDRVWGARDYPALPAAEDYLRFSPFAHPSVMFRGDVLRANNYRVFPRTVRCEDYELFMRLQSMGMRGTNLKQRLYCYRESRNSWHHKTLKNRWNEILIRHAGFHSLGISFSRSWIYMLRPLAGMLIPDEIILQIKKRESSHVQETGLPGKIESLLENSFPESCDKDGDRTRS